MAQLKENTINIFNYVKEHESEGITAQDIGNALGLGVRSVNGVITGAFSNRKDADGNKKPVMARVEKNVEVTDEEGNKKFQSVKFVVLTDEYKDATVESLNAEDAAKTAAKAAAKGEE
jgi:hypothetical protein